MIYLIDSNLRPNPCTSFELGGWAVWRLRQQLRQPPLSGGSMGKFEDLGADLGGCGFMEQVIVSGRALQSDTDWAAAA